MGAHRLLPVALLADHADVLVTVRVGVVVIDLSEGQRQSRPGWWPPRLQTEGVIVPKHGVDTIWRVALEALHVSQPFAGLVQ